MSQNKQDYIAIAKLGGPWGLKGDAKLQIYNPQSEVLMKTRFVYLKAGFSFSKIQVHRCKRQGKSWVISLEGYDSPEKVKELLNQEVYLLSDQLAPKSAGEFYVHELIGMKVMNEQGHEMGKVHSVENYGSADLLNVKAEASEKPKEYLIPWIPDTIRKVDNEKKEIIIHLLEGLIEEEKS